MKTSRSESLDDFIRQVHHHYPTDAMETREVADVLGVHTEVLYRNRAKKRGIPFIKIGKKVFYLKKDVIEYLEKSYVQTSANYSQ